MRRHDWSAWEKKLRTVSNKLRSLSRSAASEDSNSWTRLQWEACAWDMSTAISMPISSFGGVVWKYTFTDFVLFEYMILLVKWTPLASSKAWRWPYLVIIKRVPAMLESDNQRCEFARRCQGVVLPLGGRRTRSISCSEPNSRRSDAFQMLLEKIKAKKFE